MAKKQNKIVGWIKGFINGADAKLAKLVKTDLEPKMLSVIGFSLIASIVIVVAMIVCQALEVDEKITMAVSIVGAVAMFGYIIKMLLSNIKLIQSIGMKILYIVLNFVAVFIAGALAGYALSAVIMLVIAYFALMLVLGGFGGSSKTDSEPTADELSNCRYFSNYICKHPNTDFSNDHCTSNGNCQSASCQFYK